MSGRGEKRARLGCWVVAVLLGGITTVVGSAAPGTSVAEPVTRSQTCTISGTPRADHLVGRAGRDVICGRGGADVIKGAGGRDILRGGDGRDRLLGGSGEDVLEGGLSNDDLSGGPAGDEIDGGPGTNWCTLDAADTANRCVYDETGPTIESVEVSSVAIDVTDGPQVVVVRAHLTDDTGVRMATASPANTTQSFFPRGGLYKVEGDIRDGWWERELTFSRWTEPGTYEVQVRVWDRIGREINERTSATIEVQNATPDVEPPEVTLLAPDPVEVVDVRNHGVEVAVKARLTDDLSGVGRIEVLLWEPLGGSNRVNYYFGLGRVSGDQHDGTYRGTIWIDQGAVSGNWYLEISAYDRADQVSHWYSPGYPHFGGPDNSFAFPDGWGQVPVNGVPRDDVTPPKVEGASVSPTQIDTLPGPASVHLNVSASDETSGVVDGLNGQFVLEGSDGDVFVDDAVYLTSGNQFSGGYEGDVTFPQGMPPGIYRLRIFASDHRHNNGYTYFPDTTVTVVDHAQGG